MKKLIAMGMAGAMSAALLAGCGGAASSAADTASTASTGTEHPLPPRLKLQMA